MTTCAAYATLTGMTDEVKPRRSWGAWIWAGVQLLWAADFLYRRVWPSVWLVLASGGKRGVPELLNLVGPPLAILAAVVLAFRLASALWRRLSDRDRLRAVWIACALPAAALPVIVGAPAVRSSLANLSQADPFGIVLELGLFILIFSCAYGFSYALTALSGWLRTLTCLGLVTAGWCAAWTAIAAGQPPEVAMRLDSLLLILGPIVITWGVALAYWRIDLDTRRAVS